MIAAGWALLAAAIVPAAPVDRRAAADFAVFELGAEARHGVTGPDLAEQTHHLLTVMSDLGLIDYRRADVSREQVASCLTGSAEPDPERRACLRRAHDFASGQRPLVVIVLGFTEERGAWQRMECVGPQSEGESRYVYVTQAFHPRADLREEARRDVLRCVAPALAM
ncbi:hypothetical protein E2493_02140 [Sphingomonas parva]|uniref:Uncharacterized protein n=1 Tax=Sphingomonas parva TaxID=2555898 RepID=A0A4Y8ZVL8_9SPHN|nr:hypothetical protein [Sphingomonas parva]TFI60068.1 hypothetical protein E2493_02140 [Sphingomonas parva]